MKNLTASVDDVLLDFNNMIVIKINYIHKTKLRITLKYHWFEVVTFKSLDFEGHKYKEVD